MADITRCAFAKGLAAASAAGLVLTASVRDLAALPVRPDDPAYPVISDILGVVPSSGWAFARVKSDGDLAAPFSSHVSANETARLSDEFARQRTKARTGPRIAATLGPLDNFESGITLLFADARATFGILTILRTAELGPFTSREISVLTLALSRSRARSARRTQAPGFFEATT